MSKAVVEPVADEVLVRQARAGDCVAFVDFATRWWPGIARVAWSMLGNVSQAVAVTEEVVVTVLGSPAPPEKPPRFAMYRLAIWLAIVRRRSTPRGAEPGVPLLAALDRLENMDRAALLLRDVEELPVADVAAILESSAAEIQARVHRARVLLTNLLGDAVDCRLDLLDRRTA